MTKVNFLALFLWKPGTGRISAVLLCNFAYDKNKSWFVNCTWSSKTVNDYIYLLGGNWSCSFLFGTLEVLTSVGPSFAHDLKLSHLSCHFAGVEKDFILDTCENSCQRITLYCPTGMLVYCIILMKSLSNVVYGGTTVRWIVKLNLKLLRVLVMSYIWRVSFICILLSSYSVMCRGLSGQRGYRGWLYNSPNFL